DVRNQNCFFMLRSVADDTGPYRHVVLELNILLKPEGKAVLQFLSRSIQQQDAEHLVVDQPAEQFGNALKELIQIENRGQLAGNFVEQQQGACLARSARMQARV